VAVEEAAAVIFVVDGQAGLCEADREVWRWLRTRCFVPLDEEGEEAARGSGALQGIWGGSAGVPLRPPVFLAVNKCESPTKGELQAAEFWALGAGEPRAVSAVSGTGAGELLDAVVRQLPPPEASSPAGAEPLAGDKQQPLGADTSDQRGEQPDPAEDDISPGSELAVAILGRPNVGKSSLLNALAGEERSIVSPVSGTTRDAVDTPLETPDGRKYLLVDTAGVRRRGKVAGRGDPAEQAAVEQSLQTLGRADVAVLVLDAAEVPTAQDFRLAERVAERGLACVLVVNKWDAVEGKGTDTSREFEDRIRQGLRPVEWAPVVFTSATTGQRVPKILDAVSAAGAEYRRRLPTATVNLVIREALAWRSPPGQRGKFGRVYYCTQAATSPPTFVFFVNDPKLFPDDYRLYMERQLRSAIGFEGTSVRLLWRGKPAG
jgi:GTP-binding protein